MSMSIFLFFIFTLLILFFLSTIILYYFVFYSPHKNQNNVEREMKGESYKKYRKKTIELIEKLNSREYELVHTMSFDGLILEGRYYKSKKENMPVALCAHGYRSTSIRDFSGGSEILFSLDFNLFLIAQRSSMGSEGHTISFGVNEGDDLLRWVKFVKERMGNSTPIYLVGVSMGAYTVLSLASRLKGVNVRAIVADSPYLSPEAIIKETIKREGLPLFPFLFLVKASAFLWGGFILSNRGAIESVKNTNIPILIIHGKDDHIVPYWMSEEIKKANPKRVELILFPTADHVLSYMVDKRRYINSLVSFILSTE